MNAIVFALVWIGLFSLSCAYCLYTYLRPFQSLRLTTSWMRALLPEPPLRQGRIRYLWTHETEVEEDTPDAHDWFTQRPSVRTFGLVGAVLAFGMLVILPAFAAISLLS